MRRVKKLVVSILAVFVMMNVMVTPVFAAGERGQVTVVIESQKFESTYDAYDSLERAKEGALRFSIAEGDFPVIATIEGKYGGTESIRIESYGTYQLKVSDVNGVAHGIAFLFTFGLSSPSILIDDTSAFATIEIVAPNTQEHKSNGVVEEAAVKDSPKMGVEEQYQLLMEEIKFPLCYADYSIYAQEVKAFLLGEWDGHRIEAGEDDMISWSATRYVDYRTYCWIAVNMISGESVTLTTNIDYAGYKDIIPATTRSQDYSLAVSYVDGVIEQWSLFERRGVWTIDAVARGQEKIECILPIADGGDAEGDDDLQAIVSTLDTDNTQHMYMLLPENRIEKMY